jgi:hypothetical protein
VTSSLKWMADSKTGCVENPKRPTSNYQNMAGTYR